MFGSGFNQLKETQYTGKTPKRDNELQKIAIDDKTPISEIIRLLESIPIEFKMMAGI